MVEPTLEDYRGHCFPLVRSFCEAATGMRVTLWSGKGAAQLPFAPEVEVRPVFSRRLRHFQMGALFWRLLQGPEPVVVMTARRTDFMLARLAARGPLPPGKLFLYFHWFRDTPRRVAFLRRAAQAQPGIAILATTKSVAEIFARAGFQRALTLPYPRTSALASTAPSPFRHLLFAGAARRDKGFNLVVDLVALLHAKGERIPVVIQASAEHYGKYDAATLDDIQRLEAIGYPALTMLREPLQPEAYAALFQGAICMQPYDRVEFRDRSSGVTLDALAQGAPVIAPADTWLARQFTGHSAGIALEAMAAPQILQAAQTIIASYDRYRANALAAGRQLSAQPWAPLLSMLAGAGGG